MKCVRLIMYNRILMVASTQIALVTRNLLQLKAWWSIARSMFVPQDLSCVLIWFSKLRNMKNIMTAVVDDRLIR